MNRKFSTSLQGIVVLIFLLAGDLMVFSSMLWQKSRCPYRVLIAEGLELRDSPQALKLRPGQNASLSCRSTLSSEVECQWVKNGEAVVVGKGIWKSKYDWLGSASRGDCSLRLIVTNLEYHGGLWQCTVTDLHSNDKVVSQPVHVYLLVRPLEPKVEVIGSGMWVGVLPIKNGRVTVQEGTNITANCSVCCGSPNATITWKKVASSKSVSLSSVRKNTMQSNFTWLSEAVIELMITRRDNKVTLNCYTYHDTFAKRKNVQFILDVLYPPLNTPAVENLTRYLHDMVTLECPLRGNPEPKYHWYFQTENTTWQTFPDGGQILTLDSSTYNNSGLYNCTATNEIFFRKYEASALLNLTLIEGGVFRALKATEAMILGGALGVLLLAAVIGIIVFIKYRRSGRTYVSANDKESPPEGPMDPSCGTGADGDTQLNQMAWNTETTPKEVSVYRFAERPNVMVSHSQQVFQPAVEICRKAAQSEHV